MKWLCVLALTGLCAACSGSAPAGSQGAATGTDTTANVPGASSATTPAVAPAKAEPVVRELTIPAGTPLRLELQSAVASDQSRVEDAVKASLRQPLVVNGETVVPKGAELTGVVTDVERAGRVKGRARIAYRFSSLHVGGERYTIETAPLANEAAATKGSDAKKIAIGAGAGAALGALFGGGSGAAKGAAIGGAGGTGVVLATRGKEVRVGPGADVTTRLTAPLTIRVRS